MKKARIPYAGMRRNPGCSSSALAASRPRRDHEILGLDGSVRIQEASDENETTRNTLVDVVDIIDCILVVQCRVRDFVPNDAGFRLDHDKLPRAYLLQIVKDTASRPDRVAEQKNAITTRAARFASLRPPEHFR